jgi:hypothetical protein
MMTEWDEGAAERSGVEEGRRCWGGGGGAEGEYLRLAGGTWWEQAGCI